ncbi:MAG: hypothetical protein R2744_04580 [Bacteroidales bacterium]
MGPSYFDYGFGPFRWVCTSNDPADIETADRIAAQRSVRTNEKISRSDKATDG